MGVCVKCTQFSLGLSGGRVEKYTAEWKMLLILPSQSWSLPTVHTQWAWRLKTPQSPSGYFLLFTVCVKWKEKHRCLVTWQKPDNMFCQSRGEAIVWAQGSIKAKLHRKAFLDWGNAATLAMIAKYYSPFVQLRTLYAIWASNWQRAWRWIDPV